MWNITPERIQLLKEELKGRLAAIEARYAEEVKGITSDLKDIEGLERALSAFAVKHFPEASLANVADEPVVELAPLEPVRTESTAAEESGTDGDPGSKVGHSRWRIRASLPDA